MNYLINEKIGNKTIYFSDKIERIIADEEGDLIKAIGISDMYDGKDGIIIQSPVNGKPVLYGEYLKFLYNANIHEFEQTITEINNMRSILLERNL